MAQYKGFKVNSISSEKLTDRKTNCDSCGSGMYLWYVVENKFCKLTVCNSCIKKIVIEAPKISFKKLYQFFNLIFDDSIKLKRIKNLLLITYKNHRVIDGGLISLRLEILYLQPLIEAGLQENVIKRALEYSEKVNSEQLTEPLK